MSEPTASTESTVASPWKAGDWRLLGFLTRWLPNQTEPPPLAPIRFGFFLGMLEGTFVGILYGLAIICFAPSFSGVFAGEICLIVSPLWGGLIGAICGAIGGKILQNVKPFSLSLLVSFTIGAIGACLISFLMLLCAWLVASGLFWQFAGLLLLGVLACIPIFPSVIVVYREIRATLAR